MSLVSVLHLCAHLDTIMHRLRAALRPTCPNARFPAQSSPLSKRRGWSEYCNTQVALCCWTSAVGEAASCKKTRLCQEINPSRCSTGTTVHPTPTLPYGHKDQSNLRSHQEQGWDAMAGAFRCFPWAVWTKRGGKSSCASARVGQ